MPCPLQKVWMTLFQICKIKEAQYIEGTWDNGEKNIVENVFSLGRKC